MLHLVDQLPAFCYILAVSFPEYKRFGGESKEDSVIIKVRVGPTQRISLLSGVRSCDQPVFQGVRPAFFSLTMNGTYVVTNDAGRTLVWAA